MRLSVQLLRPILTGGGVFALLAAAGAYLILGDFSHLLVRGLLAVGILLIGVAVALDPEDVLRRLTAQRTLYGGNTALMIAAFVGILALVNVLGTRFSERWDLTASQQYTLSEKTTSLLSKLEQPVKVTGFFGSGDPGQNEAEDLLKEYRVRSNGMLESEFVDPEMEPGRAVSMGIRELGTLVFQQGDKRQSITDVSEQAFTTTLLKLLRPDRKKIYFTQGHGERNLESADQDGFSQVKTALEQDNYEVKTISLITDQQVSADAAALVIAGPTKNFSDQEKQAIKEYLAGGGKLILLQDPRVDVSLDDLFSQWQVSVGMDPVIDPASALPNDVRALVAQRYSDHPITQKLSERRIFSFFPLVGTINYPQDPLEGVLMVPLALSTERSWAETDAQTIALDEGKDPTGPFALGLAIEAGATDPGQASARDQGPKKTRVVIFANSYFLANEPVATPTGNLDLLTGSLNWLVESEDTITIRPRAQENRMLFLTGTQMNTVWVSSTIFLPLLVVVAGVAVWWSRR